ncbi:hypothetical protein [Burkholderia cepacia]|uniref:hypothetical protein n=1 Tax=Burkholderia cepacia TaxID=292 RepID=UPI002AB6B278|nr:hypothetical protein [Burkholderia cepacia]
MKREFAGTVPKDLDSPDANEDKVAFSQDGKRFALCDGASESFDSKLWATILAHRFATDPQVRPEWIASACAEYSAAYDFPSMSWSKQAAFERGSFATLLGVEEVVAHNAVELLAVGDSIAILVSDGQFVRGWPFEDPERFKERPTLLATVPGHNDFVWTGGFWTRHGATFGLDGLRSPRLLCMSDALGEWALRQALSSQGGLTELLSVNTVETLTEVVVRERMAKRMRIDDSTLLILSFDRETEDGLPVA